MGSRNPNACASMSKRISANGEPARYVRRKCNRDQRESPSSHAGGSPSRDELSPSTASMGLSRCGDEVGSNLGGFGGEGGGDAAVVSGDAEDFINGGDAA